MRPLRALPFLLLAALTACGDLPQPFAGNPGATAARLAQPAQLRLTVPVPANSLLGAQGSTFWSIQTARALADREIPAIATPTRPGDWALRLDAQLNGANVKPRYVVLDPSGKSLGAVDGAPVPASAWAAADPTVITASAEQAAPEILTTLVAIQAAIRQSDPHSLVNRPARIYFVGVTGAPGDGNRVLRLQMQSKLPDQGDIVQNTLSNADFTLRGHVTVTPEPSGQQQVEIHWTVYEAATNKVAGDVAQGHDIDAGSLDHYWGDVAAVIADEASSGVHEVITNWTGRRHAAATSGATAQ